MSRSAEERLAITETRLDHVEQSLRDGRERFEELRSDIETMRLEMPSKTDIKALAEEIRGAKNTMRDWRTGAAVVVFFGSGMTAVITQWEKFSAFFRKMIS